MIRNPNTIYFMSLLCGAMDTAKMIDAIMNKMELILLNPLFQNVSSVSHIISRKFFA
ncbi:dehydrogenase with different specificities [Candidatus Scalindua japonica]|uniref:Dehydrogenase with different specificities n=1 Tax=Candidatus Scalindua japonica TaxID=1284222 RepID=A0A286TXZ6_9BACT|nr:dehydrogenase with different specificities [Candidatus Scalindua japonica]